VTPHTVEAATWATVVIVLGLYGLFVWWRVRVDRRKKALHASQADLVPRIPAELRPPPGPDAAPAPAAVAASADAPTAPPAGEVDAPRAAAGSATVGDLLRGIRLPLDLVPLTTMTPRPEVGDRVAFWTDRAPAERVGVEFADEIERLGYEVRPVNDTTLRATRGADTFTARLYSTPAHANVAGIPMFPSVPPAAVVVEVWTDR
jgi:hypothetical protein